jgi:GDPmannose 4,6-dehydratase
VTRKIARTVARIKQGLETKLVLGSLESRRDWGWAKDYVEAMWLTLQHTEAGDYVVATGQTHSVGDFVEAAFAAVGLSPAGFVTHDPSFDRPTEPTQLVGCFDKIRDTLGWEPKMKFEQIVSAMVEAELDLLKGNASAE